MWQHSTDSQQGYILYIYRPFDNDSSFVINKKRNGPQHSTAQILISIPISKTLSKTIPQPHLSSHRYLGIYIIYISVYITLTYYSISIL